MKQITVVIDESGNSTVDLAGFTGGSCAKVMKDFQCEDHLVVEHKKPEYFRHTQEEKQEHQRQRR
jgi:hypothetical protein